MSNKSRDVTVYYSLAQEASSRFDPGEQTDVAALMKAAYVHGYAGALIDSSDRVQKVIDQLDHNHEWRNGAILAYNAIVASPSAKASDL